MDWIYFTREGPSSRLGCSPYPRESVGKIFSVLCVLWTEYWSSIKAVDGPEEDGHQDPSLDGGLHHE